MWRRRLRGADGRQAIVARLGGRVVGFAYVGPSDDAAEPGHGHVYSLHVDPGPSSPRHRPPPARRGDAPLRRAPATPRRRCGSSPTTSRPGASTNASAGRPTAPSSASRSPSTATVPRPPRSSATAAVPSTWSRRSPAPKYYELRQWLRTQVDGMPPGTPVAPGAGAQRALQRLAHDGAPGAPRSRRRGSHRAPPGSGDVRRPTEGDPTDAAVVVHRRRCRRRAAARARRSSTSP